MAYGPSAGRAAEFVDPVPADAAQHVHSAASGIGIPILPGNQPIAEAEAVPQAPRAAASASLRSPIVIPDPVTPPPLRIEMPIVIDLK